MMMVTIMVTTMVMIMVTMLHSDMSMKQEPEWTTQRVRWPQSMCIKKVLASLHPSFTG